MVNFLHSFASNTSAEHARIRDAWTLSPWVRLIHREIYEFYGWAVIRNGLRSNQLKNSLISREEEIFCRI